MQLRRMVGTHLKVCLWLQLWDMGLTGPCSDWRGTIKPLHLSLPLSHPVMIQERLGLEKGFSQQECPEDGWGEAPCDTSDSDSVSRSVMSDFLDPMSCSLPGSSVHGILQTRILEWAAIPFSRGSSQSRDQTLLHCRHILYCLSHWGWRRWGGGVYMVLMAF